jgi:predicted enzyme related to lactoylglutathione lyase
VFDAILNRAPTARHDHASRSTLVSTIALDTFSPEGTTPHMALETDDIEADVARLKEAGVQVLMDLRDSKVCKMAIIKDSEGNGLMLHQIAPDRAKS